MEFILESYCNGKHLYRVDYELYQYVNDDGGFYRLIPDQDSYNYNKKGDTNSYSFQNGKAYIGSELIRSGQM